MTLQSYKLQRTIPYNNLNAFFMKKVMSCKSSFKVLIHMGFVRSKPTNIWSPNMPCLQLYFHSKTQLSHHIVTQGARMVMHVIPNESFGQPVFLSFKILDISTQYALLLTIYTWYTQFIPGSILRFKGIKIELLLLKQMLGQTLLYFVQP